MIPIITDLRNAYEAHDHDAFHGALKRLEEMLRYIGPVPQSAQPLDVSNLKPGDVVFVPGAR